MERCRACLCADKKLFEVDEHFISSYNLLTNLNVKPNDLLPKCFCPACTESVQIYITFREKCISSESTLHAKFMNTKSDECEIELINIKKEPDNNCYNNCQYELVDINDDDINDNDNIKEEKILAETEPLEEKGRNPLEMEDNVNSPRNGVQKRELEIKKRPRGRPRKSVKAIEKHQQILKVKTTHFECFCGLCDESFVVIEDLNTHLEGHRTDNHCRKCSKDFENWPKLLSHRAVHSGNTGKYCHLCSRRFYSLHRMEQHYLSVHFQEEKKEMCCAHCQKTFACPERFSKHMETHNLECHICPEIFSSKQQLVLHSRTHNPEKRYQCDQCEYTAVYANVLNNHKRRRHKKFSCKTCDRQFADKASLKTHACKDKSKLCPVCGQRIYNSFKRHMLSHLDGKTFKCEKCPVSYKNAMSLKIHMDRHDNNPRHECDYCGRKFYFPTSLVKHRRTHTGEKPYPCKICGKRFAGSYNLRVHMKTHGIMLVTKKTKYIVEEPVVVPAKAPH